MTSQRIYLDNAATSWPKPGTVYQAVARYLRDNGAAAGRGIYREGVEADRIVEAARQRIARLINAPSPSCIVFTLNCTDALNLAIHGLLREGDRAITTETEHNSVLRPLHYQQQRHQVNVEHVACDERGVVELSELERVVAESPRLVAITQASNVTGAIQPIEQIAGVARRAGAAVLVDAAQSAGHLPIDVQALGIDLLAASGHKGLLGPLGTGFLYLAPGMEKVVEPLRQGGTGTLSDELSQPTAMPDRYESGNVNVPGLAGLAAGVDYVLEESVATLHQREQRSIQRLMESLSELPGIHMLGPAVGTPRVGLVAFTVDKYDPREFATLLDAHFGIQVRAGLHCAPLIHQKFCALPTGTVRISVGPFTTDKEIDQTAAAVREVVAG
jgi:cysteine desulfurase family protein